MTFDDRYLPATMKTERALKAVLAQYLSEEAAVDIMAAISDYVDAKTDDLSDRVNSRGLYDPDL